MKTCMRWAVSAAAFLAGQSAWCASTAGSDALPLPEAVTQVAGSQLKLNGTAVSLRFVFKVYAISLYLQDRKTSVEDVLRTEGPQRLVIVMLRDIDGDALGQSMMEAMAARSEKDRAAVSLPMSRIGTALASDPRGLRKGDKLTLDWVPGVGTVVELNRRRLAEPMPGKTLYHALLNIWLGGQPADPLIKAQLLGQRSDGQASASFN